MSYSQHYAVRLTPQNQAIPFSGQVANNAGGFGWDVDDWTRLHRFLVLGSLEGTYYVNERTLTRQNADAVVRCLQADGKRVIDQVVAVSTAGRAPKNEPALFVLALAAGLGTAIASANRPVGPTCYFCKQPARFGFEMINLAVGTGAPRRYTCEEHAPPYIEPSSEYRPEIILLQEDYSAVRRLALAALPEVARTGTHLFTFAEYVQAMRGWGRSLRSAVAGWYQDKEPGRLAYQVVKYQQRNGWAHRDLLRLAHPKATNNSHQAIYHWVARGWPGVGPLPHPDNNLQLIWAFERAKEVQAAGELVQLIHSYGLTREMLPTEWLNNVEVWRALLDGMPLGAMIRNLGKMTEVGLLKPLGEATSLVIGRLRDQGYIAKSRLHPLAILLALRTYAGGHGVRGKLTWTPVPAIVDALNDAFYLAFANVQSTGQRILLGVDVSDSMRGSRVAGSDLSAAEAAAAQALVFANSEKETHIMAFDTAPKTLAITPKMRLDQATAAISALVGGGTDCAIPIAWAITHHVIVDAIVILTDSETWAGQVHPAQAIRTYRERVNPKAKMVVVAMASNATSLADPRDAGILNVVGFDTNVPQVIHEFLARS